MAISFVVLAEKEINTSFYIPTPELTPVIELLQGPGKLATIHLAPIITMAFTITTAEVAAALRLSKNTLIRLRASDVLRPAIHYISIGRGEQRACLRWDLAKVEETLARRSKSLPRPSKK